ncbi:hypothetical protein HHK36_030200 [Tetracentron sinense]|uniref:Uncharacterized protein n=1 Tax=Tetracentron sinense TaxID=13715 RepID=A0A835D2F7_TETSI|nr:hypothetical protein HHK36_030200 [Tetracentron sinense]
MPMVLRSQSQGYSVQDAGEIDSMYQIINDELMLDGNLRLKPTIQKNYVNMDDTSSPLEYKVSHNSPLKKPSTSFLHNQIQKIAAAERKQIVRNNVMKESRLKGEIFKRRLDGFRDGGITTDDLKRDWKGFGEQRSSGGKLNMLEFEK